MPWGHGLPAAGVGKAGTLQRASGGGLGPGTTEGGKRLREEWLLLFWRHRGKILGAFFGFLAGWLIIRYGFLRFLLLVALTILGLWIGARADGEDLRDDWERLKRRWTR